MIYKDLNSFNGKLSNANVNVDRVINVVTEKNKKQFCSLMSRVILYPSRMVKII